MQRRRIVMELRTSGKLKGGKPCMVYLKNNLGKIYNEGQADFVMTLKNDTLNFQRITFILKRLKPADDFSVNLKTIKEYALFNKTFYNILCLYDINNRFIEIHYNKGIPDTYPTEDNISRIIKVLEEKGIKEIYREGDESLNEEVNAEGKGTAEKI